MTSFLLPRSPSNSCPIKSVLQAANPHRGHVILTNLATVPRYQLVFCFDVLGSHLSGATASTAQLSVSTLGSLGDLEPIHK
ncbi:hypothetical protein [Nostoc sp. PA-18-2419]|uniref:hypothetical protein n=1 Tax=Nostoc sp. PA-18-2419 TaxID=2575443 RepID=UPI0011099321